jgi:hypothetical protein
VSKLVIREIHWPGRNGVLNEEWFVVENVSDKPFSTNGCALGVGRGSGRLRPLGTIDPGFTLQPGEKMRVVTGNPGKKAHGKPPESDDLKNYHLFQGDLLLAGPGAVVGLVLKQHEVVRATFDPKSTGGVVATSS